MQNQYKETSIAVKMSDNDEEETTSSPRVRRERGNESESESSENGDSEDDNRDDFECWLEEPWDEDDLNNIDDSNVKTLYEAAKALYDLVGGMDTLFLNHLIVLIGETKPVSVEKMCEDHWSTARRWRSIFVDVLEDPLEPEDPDDLEQVQEVEAINKLVRDAVEILDPWK